MAEWTRSNKHALSRLLRSRSFPSEKAGQSDLKALQLKMLRIQEGIWHARRRAIVLFEGFDAAGKGGSIRRLTEALDPRGFRVYPIGPPAPEEQQRHYLYRFWRDLPGPGELAIFDRSWYGRVLVERVKNLTTRWKDAYSEINEFEAMLIGDGIDVVKIFLAIHPEEQLKRFEARLRDPYKQWKLTEDDLENHANWNDYVEAADEMFYRTNTRLAPWHIIPADSKEYARNQVLKTVTKSLGHHGDWMEKQAQKKRVEELGRALKKLERMSKRWNT